MKKKSVDIIPIGKIDDKVLERLSLTIKSCFGYPCRINGEWETPSYAYNPDRKQYYSTMILKELYAGVKNDSIRTIGVTALDLYIPVFTFVFGEAQLGSHCAIISLNRLRQEYYGLPRDDALFLSRTEKEAVHELTHTFGLTHCHDVNCIMHASYTIGDTDVKSNQFCELCNHKLTFKLDELIKINKHS
jgi:archaemetzincin